MSVTIWKAASLVLDARPSLQKYTIRPVMAVLRFWRNGAGLDTHEIAARTHVAEPDVCLILATDRERRLRQRKAA